ncbi:MAG: hypothetical protein EOO75_02945 [Myxococcales bacterium]|nr:MAG: hypothetical protein EOO75_02945 [Myxococcales bacterium]
MHFHRSLRVEALDGRILRVESVTFWRPPPPHGAPLDCAALDAWLSGLGPAFERRSEGRAAWCEWRWREGEHQLHLWLEPGNATLGVTWRPGRYEALWSEAERTLEQRELARQKLEHDDSCRRCVSLRPGHSREHAFTVTEIDRHACTAVIRPDDGGGRGHGPVPVRRGRAPVHAFVCMKA